MHDWQGGVIELAGRCDIRDVEIHDDVSYSFFRHEGISWLVGRDFHRVGAEVVAVQIVVVEETYNLPLLAPYTHTLYLFQDCTGVRTYSRPYTLHSIRILQIKRHIRLLE
jgi:hypothetical protein